MPTSPNTKSFAVRVSAKSLSRVLNQRYVFFGAIACELFYPARQTVQMSCYHRSGAGIDESHYFSQVHVASFALRVGKHGPSAGADDHINHVVNRVGGQDDFLSWLYELTEGQI